MQKDRAKSQDSNETEIFCATCGLLVSEKLALKHMEKCYNKVNNSKKRHFKSIHFKNFIQSDFDYIFPQLF